MVNALATQLPELAAGAAFYGTAPPAAQVPRIKAQLLHVFAGNDARVNGTWPGFEAALKANGVHYAGVTYPRTEHGFNNDTTPRYDGAAARQAWSRTVALFNGALRA